MSRTCVCPVALLCRSASLLLFTALGSPLLSQAVSSSGSGAATAQSDTAAIKAMQNIIVHSGGEAAWRETRSAEEAFSVLGPGEKTPQVMLLLDDWSPGTTRYRRKVQGQKSPPTDHNGAASYSTAIGTSQVSVPEFDQARVLVSRLPAAAAEVMLRRSEYVLKISKAQICKGRDICLDVYRTRSSILPPIPEQQWKISAVTGLPITVRYQTSTIGKVAAPVWREVYFLRYAAEDELIVPVSIGMVLGDKPQTWTFVSLKKNPGFDISKFDQEAAQ